MVGFLILALIAAGPLVSTCFAKAYPVFYRGVRPLGMGGAFTAVADDENALFYNPAGISHVEHLSFDALNLIVELSEKSMDLYEDMENTDMDDPEEVNDLLKKYVGEHQHARVALYPNVGFQVANVGVLIGVLAQGQVDLDVRNPAWPEAHCDVVQDTAFLAGGGLKVPIAGLRVGAAIKSVSRESLEEIYTAPIIAGEDFDKRLEDDMKSGSGFALDVGAIYRLPFVPVLDTDIGLAIQNIPEMDMGDAKDVNTQVNFGIAVGKSLAKFKLVGALDYVDVTREYEEDDDLGKRLHMGVELQTPLFISVRAGLNQGYLTAGATADFRFVRLDFATYTEEVGAFAGQREDQRYIFQLTAGW